VPNTGKAVLKKKLPEFAMDVPGLKVEIGRLRPMGESLDNGTGIGTGIDMPVYLSSGKAEQILPWKNISYDRGHTPRSRSSPNATS
jgi:hypothetical protein